MRADRGGRSGEAVAMAVGAVQGVVGGIAAWFALNQMYRINDRGFLERLPWPTPGWLIFGAVGAVVGLVLGRVRHRREQRRRAGMAEVAAASGLAHEATAE